MINRFGFYHIRSTRSLTRVMRRHARRLKRVMKHVHHLEKEADEDFKKGIEEKEFNTWKKLFNEFEGEEHEETFLTTEELKILRSQENEENTEGSRIEKIKNKLGKDANMVYPTIQNMQDIIHEYSKLTDVVRVDMKDLYLKRMERFLKYQSLYGSKFIAWDVKHLTRVQKRDIKHDHKETKKFNGLLDEIEKILKGNNQIGLKEKCDELNKESKMLKKIFITEIQHAATLFHYIDILHMRLLKKVNIKIPSDLKKLKEAGFDEKLSAQLDESEKHLVWKMGHNIWKLYQMTRYLQRHTTSVKK